MVADKGKKSKAAEDSDHVIEIDGELVVAIENLQNVQDELEKVIFSAPFSTLVRVFLCSCICMCVYVSMIVMTTIIVDFDDAKTVFWIVRLSLNWDMESGFAFVDCNEYHRVVCYSLFVGNTILW